ncbi:hypothetical protein VTI74DRAFT_1870 [Chaetomium olivicolor]
MREVKLDPTVTALEPLHASQKELFDTIDELRSLGVGKIVDLPQVIVVGDQSSGKSSVLEAICRVRFPVRAELCTRFATELALRTDHNTKIEVSIERRSRGPDTEEKLRTLNNKDEIPDIIEEAKQSMGIGQNSKGFSSDVLRIRIFAQDVPNLTLVDLPGFYHGSSQSQKAEGRLVVDELVRSYMQQPSTIILAVVSARTDIVQQKVLDEAAIFDPERERTLGVITQLDRLDPGSETEKYFEIACGNDETLKLRYPWHLLRNRSEKEAECSDDQRDATETDFLSSGIWSRLPEEDKGIGALRVKLSKIMSRHIAKSLPRVLEDMKKCVDERKSKISKLGEQRSDPRQCRLYLDDINRKFRQIAWQAVQGHYANSNFFSSADSDTVQSFAQRSRKLRALIRSLNGAFVTTMYSKGHDCLIVWDDGVPPTRTERYADIPDYLKSVVAKYYQAKDPAPVQEAELKRKWEPRAAMNQGCEFPGQPNREATLDFFKSQSAPWRSIASSHIELATNVTQLFAYELLGHLLGDDEGTRREVLTRYVEPFFDAKRDALAKKVQELLPDQEGYLIALDYEFEQRCAERAQQRFYKQIMRLEKEANRVKAAAEAKQSEQGGLKIPDVMTEDEKSLYLSSQFRTQGYANYLREGLGLGEATTSIDKMIDEMVVYYEFHLSNFTQNVVILAVENLLVRDIPNILDAAGFAGMDDATVMELAAD